MQRISIDPTPRFAISPRLYMQFMEPLGSTDASVEAAWDYTANAWRPDFVEKVRDLAPGAIRWGGILTSFWKWRESVGPLSTRRPMVNYLWGGVETNHVGVHEILDFCEAVGAEPIMAINFAADGRPEYINTPLGENRAGTPEEAADLVRYCNDVDHAERRANGRTRPWAIKLWQIGNETSYPPAGQRFTSAENSHNYLAFAKAMRDADPTISLIGWGDQERDTRDWWAKDLLREAGDQVDFIALHMMHQRPDRPDTLLQGRRYRDDYHATWAELQELYGKVSGKLAEARSVIRAIDPTKKIAITEGHLSLQPHNKCEILREWIAGLYHGKVLNLFERNGDFVEVSTLADFEGTSWLVNAVLLGSPREEPYLLPVGHVMRLYRMHGGDHGVDASCSIAALDIAASRRGNTFYLHVVNTDLNNPVTAELAVDGHSIRSLTAHEIAPERFSDAIDTTNPKVFDVTERTGVANGPQFTWTFPTASVSVLVLEAD